MGNKLGAAILVTALLAAAGSVPATAAVRVGTTGSRIVDGPESAELVAHPGRFVVEVIDDFAEHLPHSAGDHELGTGNDGVEDETPDPGRGRARRLDNGDQQGRAMAEANRRATEIAREIRSQRRQHSVDAEGFGLEASGSAVGSGLTISYNPTYPAPAIARPAISAGINAWNAHLETNGAPVVVDVNWVAFGNPGVLGFAGPADFFTGSNLPTGHLYPAALANTLASMDANGPAQPEIIVVLNADLAAAGDWHYGTGSPPFQQVDLRSVVTHEVGHGLGFVSSAINDTGPITFESPPFIYDAQAVYRGTPVVSLANISTALTSNEAKIKISSTQRGDLHTPATWLPGTSFSHFENSGSQFATLMTPSVTSGQTNRTVDGFTLGVLGGMGWPSPSPPITPSITGAAVDGTTVWLNWQPGNRSTGLPANVFRIEAYRNGSLAAAHQLSGAGTSGGLTRLQPNTLYQIQLVPVRDGVRGTPAVRFLTTGPATVLKPPSNPPPFVRNKALDGQIFRVYQAHLLRVPDRKGFNFWFDQRARGASMVAVIAQFQIGDEFTNRYGSLTDWQFVGLVYRNVLGREPDSKGLNTWTNQLKAGATRAQVMFGFVESVEYINRTSTVAPHSSTEGSIRRLYRAFFLRQPSAANLSYWVSLANGGASLDAIADQFVASAEFQNRYGSLSNEAFVALVYQNVLNRPADSDGYNHWLTQLYAGMSRGTLMIGFSESVEFIKTTGTIP